MHKVVFSFYTNFQEINLGIGFMSAALKKNGIETDVVIYREVWGNEMDTPESVVSRILGKNPTIVAFSAMTFHWGRIREVITLLRRSYDGLIIVGGYQGILGPEDVLAHPGVDGVCIGEGELPLIQTVTAYQPGNKHFPAIRGMVFRNQDNRAEAFQNRWLVENLEDYPYMDYDIFDAEGDKGLRRMHLGALSPAEIFSLPVITGRGCPYKCTYCCNSALIERYGGVKKYLRNYSPEAAVEHIKGLVARYAPPIIELLDETFVKQKSWVKDFCFRYKAEIGLPYIIWTRIDSLDEEIVSVLAQSGLKLVFFGLESGDEEYRTRYLNRKMSNKTIREGARLLKDNGIMIVTTSMFGMPFETKEAIERTFELTEAIGPDAVYPFIFQVLPGTELARVVYENNISDLHPVERWDYVSPSLDTAELPASYVMAKIEQFMSRFMNQQIVEKYYGKLQRLAKPG